MRILFFGTPDFAVASLRQLVSSDEGVVSVVTQPDRPKGRGQRPTPSPVKVEASKRGIPTLEPNNPREPSFVRRVEELTPDLICVVAYGHILSKDVLDIPPLGAIGLHPSLLPKYRGAAPINWALIRGESVTGLTTFFMDEGMDSGEIVLQREVEIGDEENAGELSERLSHIGAGLLSETVGLIRKGDPPRSPQDSSKATNAPKIGKEDCLIRWDRGVDEVRNLIRGLSPKPAAHTIFRDRRVKVLRASVSSIDTSSTPGEIVENAGNLSVACGEGILLIQEVQLEGKRKLNIADFINGHRPELGERLG